MNKHKKIKFSIAIPTYNGADKLELNLKRFVNECNHKKFKDFFELNISDNCSTDNTKQIINKYIKILSKKNFVKINYFRTKKNEGYYKNLLNVLKISKGEYITFLADRGIPEKGLYNEIFQFFKKKNLNGLGIIPLKNETKYIKKMFSIDELALVVTRGSMLSGVVLKRKKISLKYIKSNIYAHNIIYINYYLKYGFEKLSFKKSIQTIYDQTVEEKFRDRVCRKIDFAVLDKIESVDLFYRKNKINFIFFLITISKIYLWCIEIKLLLKKEGHEKLSNNFFKETLKYKNKKIILLAFIMIIFKYFFTKKIFFILNSFSLLIIN